MGAARLPRWVWLLPLASAIAAVLAWTVWCDTERGTWLGGVLVLTTGLLVLALVHEQRPHERGMRPALVAWGIAILFGGAAVGIVLLAAGLGYYLRCRPF